MDISKSDTNTKSSYFLYAGILKIVAIFAVIVLHVAAKLTSIHDFTGFRWQVLNVFDSISRWCVPVFIMVSGIFFLNLSKKLTIKDIWKKYIKKLIIIFLVWSTLYSLSRNYIDGTFTMKNILKQIVVGKYHMWFIYMIIGLYLLVPILRKIVEDKKVLEYFLVLSFIFGICINTLLAVPTIEKYISIIVQDKMNLYFFSGIRAIFY